MLLVAALTKEYDDGKMLYTGVLLLDSENDLSVAAAALAPTAPTGCLSHLKRSGLLLPLSLLKISMLV